MTLERFSAQCQEDLSLDALRAGVIGEGVNIPGLAGNVPLVYADYTASGRALRQVETFIMEHVLPFYANSHTEASYCGAYMTELRREARAEIARITNAGDDGAVIFTGSGATSGINRLVSLFGVNHAVNPVVLIGPYEHHSNILPWRESKARVIEIAEGRDGGPEMAALEQALKETKDSDLVIGSFSAASNVTGMLSDVDAVTAVLKAHGARAVWDYAGGGPYLPIDMSPEHGAPKDAVVVSPHKFPGGPGASGVLIVRYDAVTAQAPSWPGGGTVTFVSPWSHAYTHNLIAREEAGTPNIVGDIRAALAFVVKDYIGQQTITAIEARYNEMAQTGWAHNPHLEILGAPHVDRLPIYAFRVKDKHGNRIHHQLFTKMLSDIYGIQARGGCACAGPYAHRLLNIDQERSAEIEAAVRAGREIEKPGWVRLNFSYMMTPETVRYIIESVIDLAANVDKYIGYYHADDATARFAKAQDMVADAAE